MMTRKNLKSFREKPLLKNDKNKSIVAEEINLEEAKKSLIKEEYTLYESKFTERMHSRPIIRDDGSSDPWYFTHI
jgi:hypothetical protein